MERWDIIAINSCKIRLWICIWIWWSSEPNEATFLPNGKHIRGLNHESCNTVVHISWKKKPMHNWTCAVQTYVVQGSTLFKQLYCFIFLLAVVCLVAQLCLTLWDPMDCRLPGSSVHGDSPGKNTGVGCHALLQGIFSTQGLNPSLPHCRWIPVWAIREVSHLWDNFIHTLYTLFQQIPEYLLCARWWGVKCKQNKVPWLMEKATLSDKILRKNLWWDIWEKISTRWIQWR